MLAVTTLYSVILLIASRVSRRASRITKVKTCNASSTWRLLVTFHKNNKEINIIQAPTVLTENANQSPLSFPNVKIMPMVLWLISQSPAPFSGDGMYMRSMTVSTVGRSSPTARWQVIPHDIQCIFLTIFIYLCCAQVKGMQEKNSRRSTGIRRPQRTPRNDGAPRMLRGKQSHQGKW